MNPTFGRVLSAMVTPFDENEDLDLDAAQALASWLVESQGHEGLVLAGTTGESPTLTHDEQGQLFRAVREAVNVPIIAGTGSNNTRAAVDLTKRAVQAGVDGLLVVTPYYNRPSQAALVDHFTAVAAAGDDVPTLIYDIPARAGRKVETENLLTLAHDVSNIVGIKDAAGDPADMARTIENCWFSMLFRSWGVILEAWRISGDTLAGRRLAGWRAGWWLLGLAGSPATRVAGHGEPPELRGQLRLGLAACLGGQNQHI